MIAGCLTIIFIIFALIFFILFPTLTIGIGLIIWGIYEYRVNKKLQANSKIIPTIIAFGVLLFFIGIINIGDDSTSTVSPDEQIVDSSEKKEQSDKEDDTKKEFTPELKVSSEIIENELIIKGETNLPDKTLLIVTLLGKDDKDIELESTVVSGTFKVDPIPIEKLKDGKQSYNIRLAEDQFNSVTKVIGENGDFLSGELVDEDKGFIFAFTVNVKEDKETTVASNDNENDKNKETNKDEKVDNNKTQKKPTHTSGTTDKIPVTLVKTVDGDTIKVIYDGQEHNVRYLLIDTPETNHPRLGKQPFGEEAKEKNRALVNSGQLYLEFDVGERFDKYGRLLAYVYVGNTLVQEQLLKEGLARVAYVYPPNTRHLDKFEKAQKTAKDKKIGIWSIENYVSDDGYNSSKSNSSKSSSSSNKQSSSNSTKSSSSSNSSSGSKSSSSSSKSSSSSSKSSSQSSSKSSQPSSGGNVYYKNCTEARNAGAAPVYKGDPGYGKHLDRDGDGVGCE